MARPLRPLEIEQAQRGPEQLIATANSSHDRFKLLEDPSTPESNLTVRIHPVFAGANFINAGPVVYQNIQQSLRLASLFLECESVLEWLVAPLMGMPLRDSRSRKIFLSDPLASKSKTKRQALISEVHRAITTCLPHCVRFEFLSSRAQPIYAKSTFDYGRLSPHTPTCTKRFHSMTSVKIDLRNQFWDFLKNHYACASRCERLRHDFLLATTLLHELCHAIGMMRRGNLDEPHLRLDHPDKEEWGFAWEHFMFGGIINPLDRTSSKVSFLTRKIWADDEKVLAAGGKEWSAIPMSYIAQWFQQSTWDIIAKHGPLAIPSPRVNLKLRADSKRYYVLTENEAAIQDIEELRARLIRQCNPGPGGRLPCNVATIINTKTKRVSTEELQAYTTPAPQRDYKMATSCGRLSIAAGPMHTLIGPVSSAYTSKNPVPQPVTVMSRKESRCSQKRHINFDETCLSPTDQARMCPKRLKE